MAVAVSHALAHEQRAKCEARLAPAESGSASYLDILSVILLLVRDTESFQINGS